MGRSLTIVFLVSFLIVQPVFALDAGVDYFGNSVHEKEINKIYQQVQEEIPIATDADIRESLLLSLSRVALVCGANTVAYGTPWGLVFLTAFTSLYVFNKTINQYMGEIPEGEDELYWVENHENGVQMILSGALAPANQCVHESRILGLYIVEAWNRGLVPGIQAIQQEQPQDLEQNNIHTLP